MVVVCSPLVRRVIEHHFLGAPCPMGGVDQLRRTGRCSIMSLGRTLLPILLLMGSQVFSDASAAGSGDFRSLGDRLAPCPGSPNCVSSQTKGGYHAIPPIPYSGSREDVLEDIKTILQKMKRSRIITVSPDYLHAEFRTLLGFVDDVEFYIDQEQHLIHMRSASRLGYWDLGVNRRRLEAVRVEFDRLGSKETEAGPRES
jgi:uncharacterized protein (DUF1499 family)